MASWTDRPVESRIGEPTATASFDPAVFAAPPAECRPIPIWFWNGDVDPDEVVRQVRLMAADRQPAAKLSPERSETVTVVRPGRWALVRTVGSLARAGAAEAVCGLLDTLAPPEIQIHPSEGATARQDGRSRLYFIANASPTEQPADSRQANAPDRGRLGDQPPRRERPADRSAALRRRRAGRGRPTVWSTHSIFWATSE